MAEIKRIYLSGPMKGIPKYNFPEFHRICKRLRNCGYFVYNPAEDHEGPKGWKFYMQKDIRIMLNLCLDAIVLMPGWKDSEGAEIELYIAKQLLKIPAYEYIENSDGFELKELKDIIWSRSIL